MQKLIGDSPSEAASYQPRYHLRFVIEVRSLLEYDEDFFNVKNAALRNMAHWNDPQRIFIALNHGNNRFALSRLIEIIDELGDDLLPDSYVHRFVARTRSSLLGRHRVYPLTSEETRTLRRDVANHYMRFLEVYGDAFMEAVSMIMDLGSYRPTREGRPRPSPFNNYRDLVVFDRGATALANPEPLEAAHAQFERLLSGGHRGRLFERSLLCIEDMDKTHRRFVVHGHDILKRFHELSKVRGRRGF